LHILQISNPGPAGVDTSLQA